MLIELGLILFASVASIYVTYTRTVNKSTELQLVHIKSSVEEDEDVKLAQSIARLLNTDPESWRQSSSFFYYKDQFILFNRLGEEVEVYNGPNLEYSESYRLGGLAAHILRQAIERWKDRQKVAFRLKADAAVEEAFRKAIYDRNSSTEVAQQQALPSKGDLAYLRWQERNRLHNPSGGERFLAEFSALGRV